MRSDAFSSALSVHYLLCVFCVQRRRLPELHQNKETVGELWLGLLRFYTEEFDFKEYVISIRQSKRLTTFEKQWTSKCIAIEGLKRSLSAYSDLAVALLWNTQTLELVILFCLFICSFN